jgi:hypothetical protein
MVQTKKCKVVPIAGAQRYLEQGEVYKAENKLFIWNRTTQLRSDRPVYIYYTVVADIKNGDYYWNKVTNSVHKAEALAVCIKGHHHDFVKIIACSNPAISPHDLPNIPEEFIREYVAANGAIDEVELRVTSKNKHGNTLVLTKNNTEVIIATSSDVVKQENDKILDQLRSSDKSAYKPVPVEEQQAVKEYASKFLGFHVYTAEEAFKAGVQWSKSNNQQ